MFRNNGNRTGTRRTNRTNQTNQTNRSNSQRRSRTHSPSPSRNQTNQTRKTRTSQKKSKTKKSSAKTVRRSSSLGRNLASSQRLRESYKRSVSYKKTITGGSTKSKHRNLQKQQTRPSSSSSSLSHHASKRSKQSISSSSSSLSSLSKLFAKLSIPTNTSSTILTADRIKEYNQFISLRKLSRGSDSKLGRVDCVNKHTKKFGGFIHLIRMIGSASNNGETWKACVSSSSSQAQDEYADNDYHIDDPQCTQPGSFPIALKKMPMRIIKKEKGKKFIRFTHSVEYPVDPVNTPKRDRLNWYTPAALEHEVWVEILVLEISREMIKQYICPNLPLMYDLAYCPNGCDYSNPELKEEGASCLLIANQLAQGDLRSWIGARPRSMDEWKIMIYDNLNGLAALWIYCKAVHYDIHHQNGLVLGEPLGAPLPESDGTFIENKIRARSSVSEDGESKSVIPKIHRIYRPRNGSMFILWDFQYAFSADVLDSKVWYEYHRDPKIVRDYIWTVDYAQIFNINLVVESMKLSKDPRVNKGILPKELRSILTSISLHADRGTLPQDLLVILAKEWGWLEPPKNKDSIVERYDLTAPLKVNSKLASTGLFVQDKFTVV
jgi:hypothetical protein